MAERRDQRRFWQIIPIVIATVAVITALGAIVVGLRSSLSEPTSAAGPHASRLFTAQSVTPPAAASAPRVGNEQNRVSKALSGPLRAAQDTLKSSNYPDAIARLEAADRTQGKSPYDQVVGQAYYLKGDWDNAERFEEEFVSRQAATGVTPDRHSIELWMSACLKLRNDSCEKRALDKLVAYYPTPETQRELVRLQAAR